MSSPSRWRALAVATAARIGARPKPHVYASAHLANSASLLLPVSNLTNLLAFAASGLTFLGFTALMTLPWIAVIVVEYLVFRLYFRDDLRVREEPEPDSGNGPAPRYALVVLALNATDPGATKDFEHFCATTGCELLEASEQPGGILRFRMRKPG